MHKILIAAGLLAMSAAVPASALAAQDANAAAPTAVIARAVTTDHRGTFNGKDVKYTASVEPIAVSDAKGAAVARLVAISYVAKNAAADRPVIFIFNGGPISPSHILHMGALGPKRVAVPDDLTASPDSFALVDNPYTLLDVADLVFFDPAGTGFSRIAPGVDPASQFGNVADSRQLVSLIAEWTRAHGRTGSPIHIVGESYGTLRAPEAGRQMLEAGMKLDGIMLFGQAVNLIEYAQRPANVTSYAVSLPTLAATAWHHGKADAKGRGFDRFMRDATEWADSEYLVALHQGASAPADLKARVAERLEEFTGIDARWYLANRLRITKDAYLKTLFPGQLLGVADARYVGPAEKGDPFGPVLKAYSKLFVGYLEKDLRVADARAYSFENPFKGGLNDWDWGPARSPFGDWPYYRPIGDLMARNPDFRLAVGNGWTDTMTTVGAMNLLVNQGGWPADRVRSSAYVGGHMAYSVEASLQAFTGDLRWLVAKR